MRCWPRHRRKHRMRKLKKVAFSHFFDTLKGAAQAAPFSLSKNPRVDKGPQPLMFNPALTTQGELPRRGKRRPPGGCASERMKTQRFSYFADFAARRPAAAGQFRPVSRGGTSCFLREAKPVKLKKVAFSHFFDTLNKPFGLVCSCQLMVYFIKA